MRILAINGSPRKGGNTDRIISEILRGSGGEGVEIEYHHLVDLEFSDCAGCGHCKRERGCQFEDDMSLLYRAMEEADAVVLGSPIFMGAETGMMKCFFDRLYALLEDSEGGFGSKLPPGKKAIAFFTCDDQEGDVVYYSVSARCSRVLRLFLRFEEVQTFIIPGASLYDDILDSHFATQVVDTACWLITGREAYGVEEDSLFKED